MKEIVINNQNRELYDYLKETVQKYKYADSAHGVDHIIKVISNAANIAEYVDEEINMDMLVTAAVFHDIGLLSGRENHEIKSQEIVLFDSFLTRYFDVYQMNIIGKACREHRASYKGEYSSIYSKIISDADRDCDIETMIERAFAYTTYHNPESNDLEIYQEVYAHLKEKYGHNGYAKFSLDVTYNMLSEVRDILDDEREFRRHYLKLVGDR